MDGFGVGSRLIAQERIHKSNEPDCMIITKRILEETQQLIESASFAFGEGLNAELEFEEYVDLTRSTLNQVNSGSRPILLLVLLRKSFLVLQLVLLED